MCHDLKQIKIVMVVIAISIFNIQQVFPAAAAAAAGTKVKRELQPTIASSPEVRAAIKKSLSWAPPALVSLMFSYLEFSNMRRILPQSDSCPPSISADKRAIIVCGKGDEDGEVIATDIDSGNSRTITTLPTKCTRLLQANDGKLICASPGELEGELYRIDIINPHNPEAPPTRVSVPIFCLHHIKLRGNKLFISGTAGLHMIDIEKGILAKNFATGLYKSSVRSMKFDAAGRIFIKGTALVDEVQSDVVTIYDIDAPHEIPLKRIPLNTREEAERDRREKQYLREHHISHFEGNKFFVADNCHCDGSHNIRIYDIGTDANIRLNGTHRSHHMISWKSDMRPGIVVASRSGAMTFYELDNGMVKWTPLVVRDGRLDRRHTKLQQIDEQRFVRLDIHDDGSNLCTIWHMPQRAIVGQLSLGLPRILNSNIYLSAFAGGLRVRYPSGGVGLIHTKHPAQMAYEDSAEIPHFSPILFPVSAAIVKKASPTKIPAAALTKRLGSAGQNKSKLCIVQ